MLQPEPYRTSVLTIHLLPVFTTLDMTREKNPAPRILILHRILQMRKVKENALGVVTPLRRNIWNRALRKTQNVNSVDLQDTLPSAVAKQANFLNVTRIIILHLQILVILLPELPPLLLIHLLHTLHSTASAGGILLRWRWMHTEDPEEGSVIEYNFYMLTVWVLKSYSILIQFLGWKSSLHYTSKVFWFWGRLELCFTTGPRNSFYRKKFYSTLHWEQLIL